jgi:phosphoserine aminotransferase
MTTAYHDLIAACEAVVAAAKDKPNGNLPYAARYAQVILRENLTWNAIPTQCLYILSNITHWRGDEAKKARAVFKEWSKGE